MPHTQLQTLFSKERTAWITVAAYTLFLYATLAIAFDLYVWVFDQIGRQSMSWWMNLGFSIAGAVLFLSVVFVYRPQASGYVAMAMIGLAVTFCLQFLPVPAKRFHFFQYAPLTLLVYDAIRFRLRDQSRYIWAMALVSLIGLGDETIQWLLPDRHFGVLDLVINAAAGLLTLVFLGFVVKEENYPWPGRK